jgi:predicted nucleotidyltransferase
VAIKVLPGESLEPDLRRVEEHSREDFRNTRRSEGNARSLRERTGLAFVYGSGARRDETGSSDVDLTVIGEVSFADVVTAFSDSEAKIGRETHPVFRPREFRKKLAAKNHFLSAIAGDSKENTLFVIEDDYEFCRLGR